MNGLMRVMLDISRSQLNTTKNYFVLIKHVGQLS